MSDQAMNSMLDAHDRAYDETEDHWHEAERRASMDGKRLDDCSPEEIKAYLLIARKALDS